MSSGMSNFFDAGVIRQRDRVDIPQLSIARIGGADLSLLRHGPFDLIVVPTRPIRLSVGERHGGTRTLRLCPYTVCLFEAGQGVVLDGTTGVETLTVALDPAWCRSICTRCGAPDVALGDLIDTSLHPDIPPLIQALRRHLMFPECPSEPFLRSYVELLLTRLIWHAQSEQTAHHAGIALNNGRLHGVLTAIDDHIDEPIRVSDLAQSVGMSTSQFGRAFKATLGVSPRDYIIERRLQRARELLEETDQPLSEIALDAGFSSQAHLTARFAREFGLPPGQYRKRLGASG
ncbi:MAG: AraC family transcriptional regulator [Pseudomonadota bacterium]